MINMMIIAGPASNGIASKMSSILRSPLVKVTWKLFPDGETYIRFEKDLEDTVVIVQSLYPPQDRHMLQLLFMIDAAFDLGAEKVIVVAPYLAYARQDKRFMQGEAVSIKTILKCIENLGASYLITVDIHKEESLKNWLKIGYVNLSAVEELASYFKNKLINPLVLAPDMGAIKRAERAAQILNCDYDYLEKFRDRITGEISVKPKTLNVENREILIIDDIISTGGTIALAAKTLISLGARKVYAACTHPLLIDGSYDRILSSGIVDIVATDTIPSSISKVSVANLIAEYVRNLVK
ncbi:MAG: ribose-phosphate diphosphokinase [Thermoproteales archaeon]|nr:ribose-phosphate diphosphokinase [Thermoproteales archaeon]